MAFFGKEIKKINFKQLIEDVKNKTNLQLKDYNKDGEVNDVVFYTTQDNILYRVNVMYYSKYGEIQTWCLDAKKAPRKIVMDIYGDIVYKLTGILQSWEKYIKKEG